MMEILSLIENLKRLKINLSVSDGNIVLHGKNAIPSEFLDALKANKGKIISFIGDRQLYVDFFNERAAIFEYDAGQVRWEAEMNAFDECILKWLEERQMEIKDTIALNEAVTFLMACRLKNPFYKQ